MNYTSVDDAEIQIFSATAKMLTIFPSIFLIIGSIVWYTGSKHSTKHLPVSTLFVLKILSTISFILLASFDSFLVQADGQIPWESGLLIFGTTCSMAVLEMDRRLGIISSAILIGYWLMAAFSLWISVILQGSVDFASWRYIAEFALAVLATMVFILSCWAEKLPEGRNDGSAECQVGWVNSFALSWVTDAIMKVFQVKKTRDDGCILLSDLDEIPKQYRIEERFDEFETEFNRQLKIDQKRPKTGENEGLLVSEENPAKYTLCKAVLKTYRKQIGTAVAYNLVWGILRWLTPFFLTKILHVIKFSTPGEDYISNWVGILCCVGYGSSAIILYLIETRKSYHQFILAIGVRWQINHLLFKKTLTVNIGQQSFTSGQLTNLMSDDSVMYHRVLEEMPRGMERVLTIFGSIIYLYFIMDWAAFVLPIVFIVIVPITWYTAKKMRETQVNVNEKNDKRLKIMNEIINGIRVLKMYAWETAFMKKVNQNRKEQEIFRTVNNNITTALCVTYRFTPFLIQLVTFSTYVLFIGPLDSAKVFTAAYIFGFLA